MNLDAIRETLKQQEGCRLEAYEDTMEVATIGYGATWYPREDEVHRNGLSISVEKGARVELGDTITQQQADAYLDDHLAVAVRDLTRAYPWVTELPESAQQGLANASFQLGIMRLSRFRLMMDAVRKREWAKAIYEAWNSQWAQHQTPARFEHVAKCFVKADAALR